MGSKKNRSKIVLTSITLIISGVVIYIFLTKHNSNLEFNRVSGAVRSEAPQSQKPTDTVKSESNGLITPITISHRATPEHVRAVYASSWVAGSAKYSDPLVKLIDDTEVNAIVVDVKDSTGRIGFHTTDKDLEKMGSAEGRIPDIRALTNLLHSKNIYIIGRVAVFQDPFMAKSKPQWAITKKSDGTVWKDRKGLSFLDPANREVWKYTVSIAREAYAEGFDEINFDYIRYPSDGDIKNINYHLTPEKKRADNLEDFFRYLSSELKKEPAITMSADLFGLTTESSDDMGIGQIWEKAYPYFDYLSPMIYPSHYPPGQDGFKNPADHPYEIISKALAGAINKTKLIPNSNINKIRPWLQDFNLGAVYTKEMVRAQMKAVYDKGLNSWMLWDPKNKYTRNALELEQSQ